MNTNALLGLNATAIVAMVLLVSRKYKTLLTPLTLFGGYWFISTVLAPILYLQLKLFPFHRSAIDYSISLSILYFGVLGMVFLVNFLPLDPLLSALVRVSRPLTLQDSDDFTGIAIGFLGLQFIASYCALTVTSGAGWMWLTNTREAYSYHRIGAGIWWAMAQADLMLLFLVLLFRRRRTVWEVVVLAFIFAVVDLFLGSKASSLSYPVVGMVFVNFCVRKVRIRFIVLGGALIFCSALALQVTQASARTLIDTLTYFNYFQNSAMMIASFRQFHFRYGMVTVSNLWFYVPRALYPDKPFAYGQHLIADWMYKGAAKHGFTPGMLQRSVGYADFGVMGVMATAVLDGWIAKAAYQYLVTRRNLVSFVIMGQIGFIYYIQLFPTAPFPIFWIWLLTQGAVFWIFGSLAPVARNRGTTEYVSSPVARPIDREPHPEITRN
jgi:hypothetical protein